MRPQLRDQRTARRVQARFAIVETQSSHAGNHVEL
jgi:hypothetical protein